VQPARFGFARAPKCEQVGREVFVGRIEIEQGQAFGQAEPILAAPVG
jgi:hypothetical protein